MHVTFLLLLAYVAWDGWQDAGGWGGLVVSVATLLAFFVCIVLHELGHSFTARRFGVEVPRILLLPIGGVAQFNRLPKRPLHEILIAIAGPAVNYLIVGVLLLFCSFPTVAQLQAFDLGPVQLLLVMNLTMGLFNLLPAFPMDGGRILRALLACRFSYLQATRWAANTGKVVALAGMIYLLFFRHNVLGGILFLFIMIVGELEYRTVLRTETEEKRWREFTQRLYGEPPALGGMEN